jgi:pyruvate formate lyase activating enzyme
MTQNGGLLFNIQRASLDDGPGVRTVLFFKGCPLACPWCHNPEGLRMARELMARGEQCVGCGACKIACAASAIENAKADRAKCVACGACVKVCRRGALDIAGKYYSAGEAAEEALLDKAFFEATGGGVTLSGGEPLMQPDFALEILKRLKVAGVNTCVETCGVCAAGTIERLLPYVDHWLADIKLTDEKAHLELLGAPLASVLNSLYILKGANSHVTLRCPVIPGINDNDEHFAAIRKLARDTGAAAVDVLPYHRMGRDKYAQLGLEPPPFDIPPPSAETVAVWEKNVL